MRYLLLSLLLAACSGATRNNDGGPPDMTALLGGDMASGNADLAGVTVAVVINEVFPSGSDPIANPDWIELKNVGSTAVDLTGYTLRDSNPSHATPLPAGPPSRNEDNTMVRPAPAGLPPIAANEKSIKNLPAFEYCKNAP